MPSLGPLKPASRSSYKHEDHVPSVLVSLPPCTALLSPLPEGVAGRARGMRSRWSVQHASARSLFLGGRRSRLESGQASCQRESRSTFRRLRVACSTSCPRARTARGRRRQVAAWMRKVEPLSTVARRCPLRLADGAQQAFKGGFGHPRSASFVGPLPPCRSSLSLLCLSSLRVIIGCRRQHE